MPDFQPPCIAIAEGVDLMTASSQDHRVREERLTRLLGLRRTQILTVVQGSHHWEVRTTRGTIALTTEELMSQRKFRRRVMEEIDEFMPNMTAQFWGYVSDLMRDLSHRLKPEAEPIVACMTQVAVTQFFLELEGAYLNAHLYRVRANPSPTPSLESLKCYWRIRTPAAEPREGFIYFARAANLVKIGFSGNPDARVRGLNRSSPVAVTMIGFRPGTTEDEKELHRKFRHLRSKGEWFRSDPELTEWITGTLA